ncbi:MAG TPA: NUDIX domain-containing protein [Anaerolineae bacterium]|nr:NUDIX domain-containing protein [Anaerolineae bacterium]HQI85232.1 NUDIX domain-containing protein [Anaerolineae bacterium]
MTIGRFYGGVGAVLWSPEKQRYLLLRRAAHKDFAPGVWECVTGRVDQGEGFEAAARREVREEVGVDVAIAFIIGTTHFYRGVVEPENELLGVVYGCTVDATAAIRLSAEHSEQRWVTFQEANALLTASDLSTQWLRRVLARAEIIRGYLPASLAQYYQETGFEVG